MTNNSERSALRDGLTVQEAAQALGLRSQSIYGLLRDGILIGTKDSDGEWVVNRESVERYALRRSLRRGTSTRDATRRRAIDVTATSRVQA
jgi:helix-turn-helix protein